jgi:hypothetical protein
MKKLVALALAATTAFASIANASDIWFGPRDSGNWRTQGHFVKGEKVTHAWCVTSSKFAVRNSPNGTFSIGVRVSDWIDPSKGGALASLNIHWPSLPLLASNPRELGGWAVARVRGKTTRFNNFTYEVLPDGTLSVKVDVDFVENTFRKGSWIKFYVTDGRRTAWVKMQLRGTDVAGEQNRQCRDTFEMHLKEFKKSEGN